MNKLLHYYQRELMYLKYHGKIFSRKFPKIARRLGLMEGLSKDPHVERLIESFALLTARIHQRLDDDMPEIAEAMFTIIAPQFLRTIPSTSIVAIEVAPQLSGLTGENSINRGSVLYSHPINNIQCQFRTVYPVTLLPLTLSNAQLFFDRSDLRWRLRLHFDVWPGGNFRTRCLRLYLNGPENAANIIYELLSTEVYSLKLYTTDKYSPAESCHISAVGFEEGEELLPYDMHCSPAHLLIQEYFCVPQKFHFLDLFIPENYQASEKQSFDIEAVFKQTYLNSHLESLSEIINRYFFRLNCTPVVNLFYSRAEPITLSSASAEFRVITDFHNKKPSDIWNIDTVNLHCQQEGNMVDISVLPLLGLSHGTAAQDEGIFWQSFRREAVSDAREDGALFISFANRSGKPVILDGYVASLNLACTNGELPHQLKTGHPSGDFDSDIPLAGLKIIALHSPELPIYPPEKSTLRWQLISQLSLNQTLLSGEEGAAQLREILMLYNFRHSPDLTNIINTIHHIQITPIVTRLVANDPCSLARGLSISITFSQTARDYPGHYLLCCFLDRYLALYAPVNSFTRVTTCIDHDAQTQRVWPVRAGRLSWL